MDVFAFGDIVGGGLPATVEVDEVAIYERNLSTDEIAALYNSGSGRFYDFQE